MNNSTTNFILIYYKQDQKIWWNNTLGWDEENLIMCVMDNNYFSFYQYDAAGERTYKIAWNATTLWVNGRRDVYYMPQSVTLYASPYMVVTPQGYTKHYYAENERITSQIGRGKFANISTPVVGDSLVWVKLQTATNDMPRPANIILLDEPQLAYLDTLTNRQNATSTLYFYHSDHLGSSSWITYTDGAAVQHLHYLPWGESFIDQRVNSYDGTRYTFSAKEKDTETGYSYFGARYYSSDLSIWLSVDPMAGKYPSLSPYTYCADNPIKLVDPNGESIEVVSNNDGTYSISGGTLNSDKNIYKVKDGKRTGEILGQTLTEYSFFNEEGEAVLGAVLNPNDNSGRDFIKKMDNVNLVDYISKAGNGGEYDFKSVGYKKGTNYDIYANRGMPLNGISGAYSKESVYGSARDVGNYVAGMVAAKNGLGWGMTRIGFDTYQSYKSKRPSIESMVSQSAQWMGFYSYGGLYNSVPNIGRTRFFIQFINSIQHNK